MVSSVRGVRALFALAIMVGFGALVQGASGHVLSARGASAETPPPGGESAPQTPTSDPCAGRYRGAPGRIREPSDFRLPYCGSNGNDTMVSKIGHWWISGSYGNDVIKAKGNHQRDDIWGGAGRKDSAYADPFDTVHADVEKVNGRRRLSALAPRSASELSYPYVPAELDCRVDVQGQRQLVFNKEPTIRAADSTAQTDWQTVAWSALMYHWDGTNWVYSQLQTPWLWDRPPDQQFDNVVRFRGNFWRRFDTFQPAHYFFPVPSAGYYRVAIWYHWYATATAPVHDVFLWAGSHSGQYEDPDHQHAYCYFPS